jgi:transposase
MNIYKVTQSERKGKSLDLEEFDHFVAIEWSLQTMAIAHMGRRGKDPEVFERPSNIKALKKSLASLKGRTIITFEETTTAQWLYVELHESVERVLVCNPRHNRLLCQGPKTDKIDASKLCLLLRAGLLKEVFHAMNDLYELRLLVSGYQDLVQAGVRALNQKKALERGHGDQGKHAPFILQYLVKSIELYEENKEEYEAKFEAWCRHNRLLKMLLPVAGIGVISAVKILAVVVDAHRFRKANHYLSYCGLVKHEKLSGGRSYGRRKAPYNHTLKGVYKMAALSAINGKNPIREYYDHLIANGVAEHNARHAVARYIARITYGILKTGTPYEPYRWRSQEAKRNVA